MMTWLLWSALQRPYMQHPLFRQLMLRHQRRQPLKWQDMIPIPRFIFQNDLWGALWGIIVVVLLCSGGWLIIVPIMVLTPVALIIAGTAQGVYTAVRVGTNLVREREMGHTTLHGVMPAGMAGASWAMCSFVHHTNRPITQMREAVRGVYIVLFIAVGFITAVAVMIWLSTRGLSFSLNEPDVSTQSLLQVLRLLALLIAFYVDFIQSTVLGALIGLLISTIAHSRLDAGGLAFGMFLALQFIFYALVFLVNFVLVPQLIADALHPGRILLQFAVYYFSREAMILILWRITAFRLQSDAKEFAQALDLKLVLRR